MNTTRRKFIKGVVGAAVCSCACFSFDCLAVPEEDKIKDGKGKEYLAAACGTYCGACPAYIAKHSDDDQIKMRSQKRSSSGPQKALKGIPDPGWMDGLLCDGYLHRKEYLPNLKKIREMGAQYWVKYEEARWLCPKCGLPMSWYDAECVRCGEPRSRQLFPMTENKI